MRTVSKIAALLALCAALAAGCGGGGGEGSTGALDTGYADTGLLDTSLDETGAQEEAAPRVRLPRAGEVIGPQSPSARIDELQRALVALGFKLKVDGQYGPRMVKVVRRFQKNHRLEADGLVGLKTARAINRELRERAASS